MILVRLLAILYIIFSIVVAYFVHQSDVDIYTSWFIYSDIIFALILVEWFSVLVIKKDIRLKDKMQKENEAEFKIKKLEKKLSEKENKTFESDNSEFNIKIKGNNEVEYFNNLLFVLADYIGVVEGLIFKKDNNIYRVIATFAYYFEDERDIDFKEGEGINGQVVKDKNILVISDIPKGFAKVYSGLGESYPKYIIYWPIMIDGETKYLAELATFTKVDKKHINLLKKLEEQIRENFNEK